MRYQKVSWSCVIITRAVRHRVEVSPPFLFVLFFSGRSCSARALCECWAHVPKGSTLFLVPSARQSPNWRAGVTGVDVLCLFLFLHVHVPSLCTIYIHFVAFLKWRSISQGPALKWGFVLAGHWLVSPSVTKNSSTSPMTERGKLFISHRGKQLNSPFTKFVYETK